MKIEVKLDVFGKNLTIFIDDNINAVKKVEKECADYIEKQKCVKEITSKDTEASFQSFIDHDGIRVYMMTFKNLKKTPYAYNVLYHEINHFIAQLFDDLGIPLSFQNDETASYTGGYVMEKITEKLWK